MADQSTKPPCIYCGGSICGVSKEHIIPKAIGGVPTIRQVCKKCNSGVLSDIDRELCSRSPLSVIAAQKLGSHIWQTWDVDHNDHNLLLEAKHNFDCGSMTQFPQIVFEQSEPQLRGDCTEIQKFGRENFRKVFVEFVLEAFRAHEAGNKRSPIFFEPIELNADLLERYRYPPRIFARRPIHDFKKGMTFELQYLTNTDKDFALDQLRSWSPGKKWRKFAVTRGAELPSLRFFFDPKKVLRAMFKMGVNLLAKYCPHTPVNRAQFGDVIMLIMGEVEPDPTLFQQNGCGFVWPSDLEGIKLNSGHSFRLLYDQGLWHVYSSFFGGRACSFVKFRGPNSEDWCCADVSAPLRCPNWEVVTGKILLPLRTHAEWQDLTRTIPSVDILNAHSEAL